jgi:hypothetical protein
MIPRTHERDISSMPGRGTTEVHKDKEKKEKPVKWLEWTKGSSASMLTITEKGRTGG